MSGQSLSMNQPVLKKLMHLQELRQMRAKQAYVKQVTILDEAKANFQKRQQAQADVEAERKQLKRTLADETLCSNVVVQQQVQIKIRWLKYDSEKTQYFFNEAKFDLGVEQGEATKLRAEWMNLESRRENYQIRLNNVKRLEQVQLDNSEELEMDELVLCQAQGADINDKS